MESSVSLGRMTIGPHPAGGGQEDGEAASSRVGVGTVSKAVSGVNVGGSVDVGVRGMGDGRSRLVAVGAASGTNSTSEMDNAPSINPTETTVTTSEIGRAHV